MLGERDDDTDNEDEEVSAKFSNKTLCDFVLLQISKDIGRKQRFSMTEARALSNKDCLVY